MATKYFCDACGTEVPNKRVISTINFSVIESDDAAELNRRDAHLHIKSRTYEVCFDCRTGILAFIDTKGSK